MTVTGILFTLWTVIAVVRAAEYIVRRKPQILARREEKQLSERELDALYARETADGVLERMVAEAERQAERDFYGRVDEPLRRWRLELEKEEDNGTRPDRLQDAPDRARATARREGATEPVRPV